MAWHRLFPSLNAERENENRSATSARLAFYRRLPSNRGRIVQRLDHSYLCSEY